MEEIRKCVALRRERRVSILNVYDQGAEWRHPHWQIEARFSATLARLVAGHRTHRASLSSRTIIYCDATVVSYTLSGLTQAKTSRKATGLMDSSKD